MTIAGGERVRGLARNRESADDRGASDNQRQADQQADDYGLDNIAIGSFLPL